MCASTCSCGTNLAHVRLWPGTQEKKNYVMNNYNQFKNIYISGALNAIEMEAGPSVNGGDSGCWYNAFYTVCLATRICLAQYTISETEPLHGLQILLCTFRSPHTGVD